MLEQPPTTAGATADFSSVLRLYRASLARCWLPSALLALLWGGVAALVSAKLGATDDLWRWLAQLQSLISSGKFWRLMVAAVALSVLMYGALVANIYAVAVHRAVPGAAGLTVALRVFPAALTAALAFLVFTAVGTVLFLVPGAYLWGMWQLWVVVIVVERTGPMAALSRSWHLVSGSWWRITTLVTLVSLVSIVPALLLDTVFGATQSAIVLPTVQGLLNMLTAPLIPAALVAIYVERARAGAPSVARLPNL